MPEDASEDESWEIVTQSAKETRRMGEFLGKLLNPGDAVALSGDLGAGKTTLAKGIARGAGVEDEDEVTSPSFVLVNEYQGRFPVYHADLYRLERVREVEDLGWEEFIFGSGISLVEWAEKIPGILPEERIDIRISWIGAEERKFAVIGRGARAGQIIRKLRETWTKEE